MHNDEIGIVTRSGGRRLRWLAAAIAVPLFGVVAAFGTVEHVPEPIPVRIVIEPLALSATSVGDSGRNCGPACRHLWRRRGFSSRSAPRGPFWGRFRNFLPRRQNDQIRASARGRLLQPEEDVPRGLVSGSLGKGGLLHPGRREPAQGISTLAPRILAYHLGIRPAAASDFPAVARTSGDRLRSPDRNKGEVDR